MTAVRWNVALAKKRKELNAHEQGNGLGGASDRLLAFDDMGGISRADNVGAWLSNCFSYALFVQGPYCAALLLEVMLSACMPTKCMTQFNEVLANGRVFRSGKL